MAIQIRADETSEIFRSQIQGFERNLLPLCDLLVPPAAGSLLGT